MHRAMIVAALAATAAAAQTPQRDIFALLRAGPGAWIGVSLEDYRLDLRDAEMATPLHRAAEAVDDPDLIRAMIERGARVDARDARGRTPLHYAAAAGAAPAVMAALLGAGAAPDPRGAGGETPLHVASEARGAALLTLAGADACLTDAAGRPALDAAMLEAIRTAAPQAYGVARAAWLDCL